MTAEARRPLRELIATGQTLVVPGVANALTARIVQDVGFESVYVSGAGIANTFLGVPDIGLMSLSEVVAHVAAIRSAVDIPIIVDADTGYGNAINVWHTVKRLHQAGADAIQLEDQTFPKRCGHFPATDVISRAEMVQKLRAAVDARDGSDVMLIARTDARSRYGIDEACARAIDYHEAGADVVFVEGPQSEEEIVTVAKSIDVPTVINIVEGGVTPQLPLSRLKELGFAIALHANLSLLASIRAVRETLAHLHADAPGERPQIGTWEDRQELARKPLFDLLETRFGVNADD